MAIEYADNVVARATCGLVAPRDKSLTIIGDDGVISTGTVRDDTGPVYVHLIPSRGMDARLERLLNLGRRSLERYLPALAWSASECQVRRKYAFARKPTGVVVDRFSKLVDFCRGPSELVSAIRENRSCRLSADLGLHITELIEALQHPERFDGKRKLHSTFSPIQELPWTV